jgi:ABC-2 type transport system permease protein
MMRNVAGFFIRVSAFVTKELVSILRQTPLIMTLVLGPFLIMLLFGIGYRNQARPLRTLFVIQDNQALRQEVETYAKSMGPQLIYAGIVSDPKAALQSLRQGRVDLVVQLPSDAMQSIQDGKQVEISLYHDEIDPNQVGYIQLFGNIYVNELNRRVLSTMVEQGQQRASGAQEQLASAHQDVSAMQQALKGGDIAAAQSAQQHLFQTLDSLSQAESAGLLASSRLVSSLGSTTSPSGSDAGQSIQQLLAALHQDRQSLGTIQPEQAGQASYAEQLNKLSQMDQDITQMQDQLKTFQKAQPDAVVAPFTSQTHSVAGVAINPVDFFAPAVIVLLLQHLAVTFAALAIVREQRSGSMELFQISPLNALETILGKYLSYLFSGGLLVVVITLTTVLGLHVPMRGIWLHYILVVAALLFASLGFGFLISLAAKTELQAVQYSMFMLLGSVFFSGFFLDLRYLWVPVRTISWMLPATYGIRLLQDIMLRGARYSSLLLAALVGIGVVLFLVDWMLLHRRLHREWS